MAKQSVLAMLQHPYRNPVVVTSRDTYGHKKSALEILRQPLKRNDTPEPQPTPDTSGDLLALQQELKALRAMLEGQQATAPPAKPSELPEFDFEIASRDPNGAIKTVTAKPRRA